VNLCVGWTQAFLSHWTCFTWKSTMESSSLFARSISERTPGGDAWGLLASKRDRWMEMR
jgi:hypothetical protein